MLLYSLKNRWPNQTELFGATKGQEHFAPLLAELRDVSSGEVVIYDFTGIEHATASYVRATVLRLLKASYRAAEDAGTSATSGMDSDVLDVFPLVAGLSADVAEELQTVLESQGIACFEATKWSAAGVVQGRVRGVLEGVLRDTLVRVAAARQVTASMLAEREPPNVTGWNNRLAELYRMRLVKRVKDGRQWIYSAVCSEVIFG
ncbi:hypothetical protein [Melittangium boletus]|uniref:hypothetical protein n=1 Tax=Melittangium boletus TaxID=83453 RepID=UPI003DA489F1